MYRDTCASLTSRRASDRIPRSFQRSDQPTIEAFLSQVEDDDQFLHSVATQNGVTDFISPVKMAIQNNNHNSSLEHNNNNNNSVASTVDVSTAKSRTTFKSPARKSSPVKPLPPQRNTLHRYFSPPKRKNDGSGKTGDDASAENTAKRKNDGSVKTDDDALAEETAALDVDEGDSSKPRTMPTAAEKEAKEEDFSDDFDWLPPDDEEDPFLSQLEPNKRRRLLK